jgi:type IV pilus assembly protein PilZ
MSTDIPTYSLRIADRRDLLLAYMPFVINGGVFLKGAQHPMGSSVGLVLETVADDVKVGMVGKVVWISQRDQRHEGGIGVQFPDTQEAVLMQGKIETALVGLDRTKEKPLTA